MKTVKEVLGDLKEALKLYGEYTFYDKGPGEVMLLDGYYDEFSHETPEAIGEFLVELFSHGKEAERLAEYFLMMLQTIDDQRWDRLMEVKGMDKIDF